MSSYTGISPKDPNKYLGPTVFLSSIVTRNRNPTGADYRNPNNGKIYAIGSFWLISKDPVSGTQGDLWYLSKVVGNVATWLMVSAGSSGPLLNITVPNGVSPIIPDGAGTMNFTSSSGTITITGSTASPNNHTINFDLVGGTGAIDSIAVQSITAPGVTPVLPTGAGLMTVNGGVVANHSVVLETRSRALNAYNIEVQYSASAAATDGTKSGVAHFNSAHFSVDSVGFVSLTGGGEAIDSIGVDGISGTGTNPVLPTAGGLITVNGSLVAAGTNPIRTISTAPSIYQIQVQTSQALAAADSTKVGLSNFDSTYFLVDANGFVTSTAFNNPGQANLGISQSAGTTFTVLGSNGVALSSTNPAFVTLQSLANPGQTKTYKITANQSFTQANIAANNFGLTNGVALAQDVPFFLYAVSNANNGENTITFMVSRYPNAAISPVAGKIAKSGSAVANSQASFFALNSGITVADYASSPCLSLGSFRMRWANTNNWTIQTLSNRDGIGEFQAGVTFIMPVGQFGNASGAYFLSNGGTAPIFTNQNLSYYIHMTNEFSYWFAGNACSTAGVGAVQLLQGLPYFYIDIATQGSGVSIFGGAYSGVLPLSQAVNGNQIYTVYINAAATGSFNNGDIVLTMDLLWNGRMSLLFS